MEDFTQLPAVGLDYAGATAQAAPRLGPTPEEIVPPHIAAVIDARAKAAKSTISEASLLAGSGRGETLQEQVEKEIGKLESWETFNKKQDQGPDVNAAMQQFQQAGANRPQMPDVGRPQVDQTQQFIAALGALFDPKNAGQIMGLPQQNAQTDYEYKVKDAMRRYQLNNNDYEAKLELAKAVYENVQREAGAVRGDNRAAYNQYAQTYRNDADNIASDIRNREAILGRDVALDKRIAANRSLVELKEAGAIKRILAKDYAKLAGQTPEGRYKWAIDNKLGEETATALSTATAKELNTYAKTEKIAFEIDDLKARTRLNEEKAKQVVRATRLMGEKYELEKKRLAGYIRNIGSLVATRNRGLGIASERLKIAQDQSKYVLSSTKSRLAGLEATHRTLLNKLEGAEGADLERYSEQLADVESAIAANEEIQQGIYEDMDVIEGVDPSAAVQQYNDSMMGGAFPLPLSPPGGGKPGTPFAQSPRGGYREQTKPGSNAPKTKVKPKRGGLQITNIRVSG